MMEANGERILPMECLRVATVLLLSTIPFVALAQSPQQIPIETAQSYFAEAQSLCQADHGQLWGVSLCGPIMFVDPPINSASDSSISLAPPPCCFVSK